MLKLHLIILNLLHILIPILPLSLTFLLRIVGPAHHAKRMNDTRNLVVLKPGENLMARTAI